MFNAISFQIFRPGWRDRFLASIFFSPERFFSNVNGFSHASNEHLSLEHHFRYFLKLWKQTSLVIIHHVLIKREASPGTIWWFPGPEKPKREGSPGTIWRFLGKIFDSLLMWSGQPNLNAHMWTWHLNEALEALVKSKSRASASS